MGERRCNSKWQLSSCEPTDRTDFRIYILIISLEVISSFLPEIFDDRDKRARRVQSPEHYQPTFDRSKTIY